MARPVFVGEPDAGEVVLSGAEGRHAATVRRLRTGEQVDVVDGRGRRARCTVTTVGRDTVRLAVDELVAEPVPSPRLVLVQALPKGDRGELAVELATEVGVDAVVPWAAARCVARWEGARGERALQRWRATAREAGKQSRRAWLPEVAELATTASVVDLVSAAAVALVLHEDAATPLSEVDLPSAGDVVLVVGPEGGLAESELAALTAVGGRAVRLGPSVLRTSTAGAVAAAVVSARTARWA